MPELHDLLERRASVYGPPVDLFERVQDRRRRRDRNRRLGAGVLGIAVFALAAIGFVRLLGSGSTPAGEPRPSPDPTASGDMWPQSSLEEVRRAQELADAGDARATWQLEPRIEEFGGPGWRAGESYRNAEIVERFLRDELGWANFLFNQYVGWEEYLSNMTYVRCAPGGTNALYPDDPFAGGCAPTIDDVRYETVSFDLTQPGKQGPSGIWVVSNWETGSPFAQVAPPTDAEVAAVLEPFLQARIDGEGAEEFLGDGQVPPLLYATTGGARYERSEFERVDGPEWPFGDMGEFKVRLFADGGATVVEQLFFLNHATFLSPLGGPLGLDYSPSSASDTPTTENGRAVAVPFGDLEGDVASRFTEMFDSPLHSLSIGYPSGWRTRAATEPWGHGELAFRAPDVDIIFDPTLRDDLYLALVSEPLGGTSATEWVDAHWTDLDSMGICGGGGGGGRPRDLVARLGGVDGWFEACGEPQGASGSALVVATATRGYIIYLHVADERLVQATYGEDWFEQDVLTTLDLRPEGELDAPSP